MVTATILEECPEYMERLHNCVQGNSLAKVQADSQY